MSSIEFVGRRLVPASAGAAAIAVLSATSAQAHHVMDGTMPTTFMQGLLSGFGHPVDIGRNLRAPSVHREGIDGRPSMAAPSHRADP